MLNQGWPRKIEALQGLIDKVGSLWPRSMRLSGYGEKGPYHCGHCSYLVGGTRCSHPVVKADEQVKKKDGWPIVDPAHGCCEFVDPS